MNSAGNLPLEQEIGLYIDFLNTTFTMLLNSNLVRSAKERGSGAAFQPFNPRDVEEFRNILARLRPATVAEKSFGFTIRHLANKGRTAFIRAMFKYHFESYSLLIDNWMIEAGLKVRHLFSINTNSDGQVYIGPPRSTSASSHHRSQKNGTDAGAACGGKSFDPKRGGSGSSDTAENQRGQQKALDREPPTAAPRRRNWAEICDEHDRAKLESAPRKKEGTQRGLLVPAGSKKGRNLPVLDETSRLNLCAKLDAAYLEQQQSTAVGARDRPPVGAAAKKEGGVELIVVPDTADVEDVSATSVGEGCVVMIAAGGEGSKAMPAAFLPATEGLSKETLPIIIEEEKGAEAAEAGAICPPAEGMSLLPSCLEPAPQVEGFMFL